MIFDDTDDNKKIRGTVVYITQKIFLLFVCIIQILIHYIDLDINREQHKNNLYKWARLGQCSAYVTLQKDVIKRHQFVSTKTTLSTFTCICFSAKRN